MTETTRQTRYANGVRSAVSMLKLEQGCADCGYAEDPAALDFDHTVPGRKTSAVGYIGSLEGVLFEIEFGQCEVVCANCHRIRTANRRRAAA